MVSPDRRNYLEVIRALGETRFSAPVELYILGRCPDRLYGAKIAAEIQRVSSKQFNVVFDPDSRFVPADELRRRLLPMHVLLSPIQLNFSFHFYREQYGLTKFSGAEADCIRYNRPALLPDAYRYSECVAPFVATYSNFESLACLVASLTVEENMKLLNERAAAAAVEQITKSSVKKLIDRCMQPG